MYCMFKDSAFPVLCVDETAVLQSGFEVFGPKKRKINVT